MSEPSNEPRRPIALWVGLIGAGVVAIAGMLGAHNASVWRVPAVLETRVEQALIAAGQGGLEIDMDGQRARLLGFVRDEESIALAQRAALAAAGPGGPWAGGVTSVDVADVEVGRVNESFLWGARWQGAQIVLTGAAPTERSRLQLAESSRAAFPNARTVDGMHVAGGAASPRFARVARDALRALSRLKSGEVRIIDNQIVFIGDGDQAGVDALRAAFASPPPPYRARFDVTIDGLDTRHPELQGLNLQGGDADTCATAFDRLLERNVINFATGSAAIDPSSQRLLDSLASVALRCDRFRIEVGGHTDNQGPRELNLDLSTQRAEAVANYLATQGVARARLTARGYGPDRPRASNADVEGQAANRRIEFGVASDNGAAP